MDSDHKPTDYSPASSLVYTSTPFIAIIALMLTILACACASTSVDEPETSGNNSDEEITLTISGSETYIFPQFRSSDAHEGHRLRYIASLYRSASGAITIEAPSQSGNTGNLVERIEQTATTGNTITFRGVSPGYYFVVVFADYIDADAMQNSNGSYPDKYYDTRTDPELITLKASGADLFNNHNLDCFIYTPDDSFEKKAGEPLALTFNLKRCVSRIEVVASNGNPAALKDITVDSYSVVSRLVNVNGVGHTVISETDKPVSLTAPEENPSGLLFFFYTFNASSGLPLKATRFTLNANDGYAFANDGVYSVPADRITPVANIIYKVTGDFLSTTAIPSKAVDINVTTHTDWSDSSQEIP